MIFVCGHPVYLTIRFCVMNCRRAKRREKKRRGKKHKRDKLKHEKSEEKKLAKVGGTFFQGLENS